MTLPTTERLFWHCGDGYRVAGLRVPTLFGLQAVPLVWMNRAHSRETPGEMPGLETEISGSYGRENSVPGMIRR